MRKKLGVTIVELLVAMTIFMVVITLAVGAFVTVSRMKALTSTMKDSQQKTRIALEMITRLARQANVVTVSEGGKKLYVDNDTDFTNTGAAEFYIRDGSIYYSECGWIGSVCVSGVTVQNVNLLEGINVSASESSFIKNGSVPPTLDVIIHGQIIDATSNPYYSDRLNIDTKIILEQIR